MVDIHTHILPGVDDGCQTFEEALEVLRRMGELGIRKVYLTPHLNHPTVKTDIEDIKLRYREFLERLKDSRLNVEVHLGSEYYLTEKAAPYIPFDDANVVLVELPVNNYPFYLLNRLFEIELDGNRIVIAHLERYEYLFENDLLRKLKDRGVYFQVNVSSVLQKNKNAVYLLKNGYVDFLATDIHRIDDLKNLEKLDGYEQYFQCEKLL